MTHAEERAFSFQLASAPQIRMLSLSAFFTARATLCVKRYDHFAMKLGPDVKESKFNHRLWTFISDARICKRCSVNRTSFHIPR